MESFVRPDYRKTSAGHALIEGVQFHSYSVGVLMYARISADGKIMTRRNYGRDTYSAAVIGHGAICNAAGKPKAFRTQDAAARAAIKIARGN
jgi:hypothetical protein